MKGEDAEFITIGQILAPWGNKGKLKVKVLTDFPERFAPDARIYIKQQAMTIDHVEWHKGMAIIKINTIDSIAATQPFLGQAIEIHPSQVYLLPEGSYYHFQLTGLKVLTTAGKLLGKITKILATTGTDIYVVSGADGEVLIPATTAVVRSIDLKQRQMTIEAIPGLLELNQRVAK